MAANLHDADLIAVFVAEKLHHFGTTAHIGVINLAPSNGCILEDFLVNQAFDSGDLLGSERRTAEIEGQFVRADIAAFLHRLTTHDLVQSPVEQMRDSVMTLDGSTACAIDVQFNPVSDRGSIITLEHMEPHIARFLRVGNAPEVGTSPELPGVADLSAHLGIARARIEHDSKLALEIDNLKHCGAH